MFHQESAVWNVEFQLNSETLINIKSVGQKYQQIHNIHTKNVSIS